MKKGLLIGIALLISIGVSLGAFWVTQVSEDDEAILQLIVEQPDWLSTTLPETVTLNDGFEGSLFRPSKENRGAILLAPGLMATPDRDSRLRIVGNALAYIGYTVLVPHSLGVGKGSEGVLLACDAVNSRVASVIAAGRWLGSQPKINPKGTFIAMSVSAGSHSLLKAVADPALASRVKGFFLINPLDSFIKGVIFAFSGDYPVDGKYTGVHSKPGPMASFGAKALLLAVTTGHPDQVALTNHLNTFINPALGAKQSISDFKSAEGISIFTSTAPLKGTTPKQIIETMPVIAKEAIACWDVPDSAYSVGKSVPTIILSNPRDTYINPADSEELATKMNGKLFYSDLLAHTHVTKKPKAKVLQEGLSLLRAFKELNSIPQ